jgi:hypothetical protein
VKSLPRRDRRKDGGLGEAELSPEGKAIIKELEALADDVLEGEPAEDAFAVPPSPKRARRVKTVANVFYALAAGLCLLLSITMVLNAFAPNGVGGLRFFVEPTDAMKTQGIPRGALMITMYRKPEQIKPGDIITYYALPGETDTRLTRMVDESRKGDGGQHFFRTKRSASAAQDSMEFNFTCILGVKLVAVPYAGFVISFVRGYAPGLAGLAAALCVAAVILRKWLREKREEAEEKGKQKQARKRKRF